MTEQEEREQIKVKDFLMEYQNEPLLYTKLNPLEHIVKPSHTLDELLLFIGDDDSECKSYEWCEDPAKYVHELRSNGWNRCIGKKGMNYA